MTDGEARRWIEAHDVRHSQWRTPDSGWLRPDAQWDEPSNFIAGQEGHDISGWAWVKKTEKVRLHAVGRTLVGAVEEAAAQYDRAMTGAG
mgnify:CR=1 FL=1